MIIFFLQLYYRLNTKQAYRQYVTLGIKHSLLVTVPQRSSKQVRINNSVGLSLGYRASMSWTNGTRGPGSERAPDWRYQGARGPRSESSRERIGQGSIGRFAPGSELARERKGCESLGLRTSRNFRIKFV